MKNRIEAAEETLQYPYFISADAPQVVGVAENDFRAIRGGGIAPVSSLGIGRYPIGGTAE